MNKININAGEFKDLLQNVVETDAYYECNGYPKKAAIELALKKYIFNVKNKFDEKEWNECTIIPPKRYYDCYFIIRSKDNPAFVNYALCKYNEYINDFIDTKGTYPIRELDHSRFEYKVVEK